MAMEIPSSVKQSSFMAQNRTNGEKNFILNLCNATWWIHVSLLLSYSSTSLSSSFCHLTCRTCSLPLWQLWMWRDCVYLRQCSDESRRIYSCTKPTLQPWAGELHFCWERRIMELPRGGTQSWLRADKGACWVLWRSCEASLRLRLSPRPWLSMKFSRRIKPWVCHFFLLSSQGGRQFFTLRLRTASGLGEGKNFPRLHHFHLQMKQWVSSWEEVECPPAGDKPMHGCIVKALLNQHVLD